MLFMFPGTIAAKDLEAELAPFFALVRAELEQVSGLQISLLGFRGEARCQTRGKDGRISQFVFEAVDAAHAPGRTGSRMVRPGPEVCERPDDADETGFGILIGRDD